jgi:hypothetical protein
VAHPKGLQGLQPPPPTQGILRKIKWIKLLIGRHENSLKEYEWNQFKFKYVYAMDSQVLRRSEQAATFPALAHQLQHGCWGVVGRLTELGMWLGCNHCSPNAAQIVFEGRFCIYVYLSSCFKYWHKDDHFHLAVFKAMFVNVLTSVQF